MTVSNLTWKKLVEVEPRLETLLADAQSIEDDLTSISFCANAAWYGYSRQPGLKPSLVRLVGWGRIDLDGLSPHFPYD